MEFVRARSLLAIAMVIAIRAQSTNLTPAGDATAALMANPDARRALGAPISPSISNLFPNGGTVRVEGNKVIVQSTQKTVTITRENGQLVPRDSNGQIINITDSGGDSDADKFRNGDPLIGSPTAATQTAPKTAADVAHGSGSGSGGAETFDPGPASLISANDQLRSAVNSFAGETTPLTDAQRLAAAGTLNGIARADIEFPAGTNNLQDNRIFEELNGDSFNRAAASPFKDLFKQDLAGDPVSANTKNLEKLASNDAFQQTAKDVVGKSALKDFNLAVLGSKLAGSKGSTRGDLKGVNKSLDGKLNGLIKSLDLKPADNKNANPGAAPLLASVDEWTEAARILSSDTVLAKVADPKAAAEIRAAYVELTQLQTMLREYKCSDLLGLISVPLQFDPFRGQANAMEAVLASVRKTMAKLKNSPDHFVRPNRLTENFVSQVKMIYSELFPLASQPAKFLAAAKAKFADHELANDWFEADQPDYVNARRAVALLEINVDFEALRDLKAPQTRLTKLVANAFEYVRLRRNDSEKRRLAQSADDRLSAQPAPPPAAAPSK